jgi:phosphate acetyltransferase/phosphate butyryltransferase
MKIKTMPDIAIGDTEKWSRTVTESDVVLYAGLIGDRGPLHLDVPFAARTHFGGRLSYGMLHAGYIGATLAQLLGTGSAYVGQSLQFRAPVLIGDTITIETTVTRKDEGRSRVFVHTTCTRADGVCAIDGEAELLIFPVPPTD